MGNEQSVPAPRRLPNKLSKPQTNTHINSNLYNGRQSMPASRLNSVSTNGGHMGNRLSMLKSASLAGETMYGYQDEERIPLGKVKRKRFFRSRGLKRDEQAESEAAFSTFDGVAVAPEPSETNTGTGTGRWSLRRRTTGNSFTMEDGDGTYSEYGTDITSRHSLRGSRTSLQQVAYTHHQQLSFVQEVQSPPPMEDEGSKRYSQYESENTRRKSFNRARTNSDTTLHGPIRRRSLLQHGVATRRDNAEREQMEYESSYRRDFRQSLPATRVNSMDNSQNYYHNPPKPVPQPAPIPTPAQTPIPLSHIVAFSPRPDLNVPIARTETPTEEYAHTGAFKLGTLRITNGAASPAPSSEGRGASIDEDYVEMRPRTSVEQKHSPRPSERSNTVVIPAEGKKSRWIVHAKSPFKNKQEIEQKGLMIQTHLPLPDLSFTPFDVNQTEDWFKKPDSPAKSLELAKEYIQDLALSPFSFDNSPPLTPQLTPSPKLQTTSKHMAVEDDLFEAEPTTPSVDGATRMPTWRSSDSGYDGEYTSRGGKPLKGPRDMTPKPLAKADSGYSSNVSLRSFKKGQSPAVPAKDAPPPPAKQTTLSRETSSTYSNDPSEKSLRTKRSLPALPVQEQLSVRPSRQAPPAPLKNSSIRQSIESPAPVQTKRPPPPPSAAAQKRAQALPQSHYKQQGISSIPARLSDSFAREISPTISESSTTSSTPSTTSSRWRNGLKFVKRPKSEQPAPPEPVFTVQAHRSPTEQSYIDGPSGAAQQRLDERVDSFHMGSFSHTMPITSRLRRTGSKETLGTIFSVGSTEVREELSFARLQKGLPPVPVEPTIMEDPVSPAEKPEMMKRDTYKSALPTVVPAPWSSRPEPSSSPVSKRVNQQMHQSSPATVAPEPKPAMVIPAAIERPEIVVKSNVYKSTVSPSSQVPVATRIEQSPDRTLNSVKRHTYQAPITNRTPEPTPIKVDPIPINFSGSIPRRSQSWQAESGPPPAAALPPHPSALASLPSQRPDFGRQSVPNNYPMWNSSSNLRGDARDVTDFETHLTSFETVSASLGRSPYDVATSTVSKPTYPLQTPISGRAKSMTAQSQADAAARFSRKSFDSIPSNFGRNTYDQYSNPPADLGFEERRKSLTAQSETAMSARYSRTAQLSHDQPEMPLQNRKSLDSMSSSSASRPSLNRNSSNESTSTRRSQKKYPPQAHAKHSLRRPHSIFWQPPTGTPSPGPVQHPGHIAGQFQVYNAIDDDDDKPLAQIIREKKLKNPPPVSMTTQHQRNSLIIPQSQLETRSVPPSPVTAMYPSPSPSPIVSQEKENQPQDWGKATGFWAKRRQSAEALHLRRPSFSNIINTSQATQPRVPAQPQPQPQQELRSTRSIDGYAERLRNRVSTEFVNVRGTIEHFELRGRKLSIGSDVRQQVITVPIAGGNDKVVNNTLINSPTHPGYDAPSFTQEMTLKTRRSIDGHGYSHGSLKRRMSQSRSPSLVSQTRNASVVPQTRRTSSEVAQSQPQSPPQPEPETKTKSSWFPVPLQSQEPPPVPKSERYPQSHKTWSGAGGGYDDNEYAHPPDLHQRFTQELDESHAPTQTQYDHTYGSAQYDQFAAPEEYYPQPSPTRVQRHHMPQQQQHGPSSNDDMLILDRYAGGLGYGFEPGFGLGGSAGTRNTSPAVDGMGAARKSVDVSMQYGVDFSDVPVFLRRVKVDG